MRRDPLVADGAVVPVTDGTAVVVPVTDGTAVLVAVGPPGVVVAVGAFP